MPRARDGPQAMMEISFYHIVFDQTCNNYLSFLFFIYKGVIIDSGN